MKHLPNVDGEADAAGNTKDEEKANAANAAFFYITIKQKQTHWTQRLSAPAAYLVVVADAALVVVVAGAAMLMIAPMWICHTAYAPAEHAVPLLRPSRMGKHESSGDVSCEKQEQQLGSSCSHQHAKG